MIFYLTSRIVGSAAAFLYPGYASYKTLSQRPASEEQLERWLMYWSVLGCIISVEYVAEWLVSWIPGYFLLKTLFLLYLALPQTQGASFLYVYHLQPFFNTHERQIDAALASMKTKVYSFVRDRLRELWDYIVTASGQQQSLNRATQDMPAAAAPPPAIGWSPAQLAFSAWNTYGPTVLASGQAFLAKSAATPRRPAAPAQIDTSQSVLARRRQLEAELAALPAVGQSVIPMSAGTRSSGRSTPSSANSGLRDRTTSVSGRYEEIEVPSDFEGYDAGGDHEEDDLRPAPQKRGSWFGWGGSQGYERVKSD